MRVPRNIRPTCSEVRVAAEGHEIGRPDFLNVALGGEQFPNEFVQGSETGDLILQPRMVTLGGFVGALAAQEQEVGELQRPEVRRFRPVGAGSSIVRVGWTVRFQVELPRLIQCGQASDEIERDASKERARGRPGRGFQAKAFEFGTDMDIHEVVAGEFTARSAGLGYGMAIRAAATCPKI